VNLAQDTTMFLDISQLVKFIKNIAELAALVAIKRVRSKIGNSTTQE